MCKVLANISFSVFLLSFFIFYQTSIKSLTFLRLPERQQATLDELHVLMQRFPRVITDMDALELEFLEYHTTPDNAFPAYFDKDDKSLHIDDI